MNTLATLRDEHLFLQHFQVVTIFANKRTELSKCKLNPYSVP